MRKRMTFKLQTEERKSNKDEIMIREKAKDITKKTKTKEKNYEKRIIKKTKENDLQITNRGEEQQ